MSIRQHATSGRASPINPLATGGLVRYTLLGLTQASHVVAAPVVKYFNLTKKDQIGEGELNLWIYLTTATFLVLLGGAFAGLTIALMGQDGVYLQVIATSGEGKEQRHAQSVYNLLRKGKHWVLVTLLLSNVIVNESLPIVLDRSLGGGWPAVLGSTVLIVIFGEVIPQSVCVRYGLSIGSYMAPCVLGLMWIMAPIAWPIAKLLDKLLGEDHGTVYKKSGLKTLVTLHKTLGTSPTERLNQDEVTIISAVLDLKDKAVGDIMTPIEDVFTMSEDTILDEDTMNIILSAGYSRIPIFEPGNPQNFVGMLLVKILITYDPEDCKKVSEFALATLPETRPETSCLDIVNFFQEGKSHMVLVSEYPAENYGAIGVVTLEDVIEELIGEEIIDESDVYIDVHKAIRRLAPAPKARVQKTQTVVNLDENTENVSDDCLADLSENNIGGQIYFQGDPVPNDSITISAPLGTSPKTTFLRKSIGGIAGDGPITIRGNASDMRDQLKHLGPSNLASRPKTTRSNSRVGDLAIQNDSLPMGTNDNNLSEMRLSPSKPTTGNFSNINADQQDFPNVTPRGEGDALIPALQPGFGTFYQNNQFNSLPVHERALATIYPNVNLQEFKQISTNSLSGRASESSSASSENLITTQSRGSSPKRRIRHHKRTARSGSITENIIEAGGIRKVILETNSSGEDFEHNRNMNYNRKINDNHDNITHNPQISPSSYVTVNKNDSTTAENSNTQAPSKNDESKKKRRKNRKRKIKSKEDRTL
ncbi:hemolysin [Blumeria hordei DH14]|uniref:Hemolysin n=1 Tax=Blumeria graminis f. sp. hordei (strain DH14) TaxID=546991 RepID=N1JB93_BLUG1|nr:hemolysin [Blumeria hordei DH14]